MKPNYLNLAIAKKCEKNKTGNCFPKNIIHDCIACHADWDNQRKQMIP